MIRFPQFFPTAAEPIRRRISRLRAVWTDAALLLGLFLLLYAVGRIGRDFFAEFYPPQVMPEISLDPRNLPYYAARSTLRMFAALGLSVIFTLSYGYAAARSRRAERVLIPLLDILQSVPVLGFLSITVTGFIALFPGRLLGLECASIFAIFTGQVWNMTFSFYHSLITLPKEMHEAAAVFRFSRWRKFISVEVPAAMIGLVWNGMMSFGGGWFFVAASEAISVLNQSYTLPGIGSYVAKAVEEQDAGALGWAILTMVVTIVVVDQLFWRPLVAWAERFRMERSAAAVQPHSWLLDLLRSAHLPRLLGSGFHWLQSRLIRRRARAPREARRSLPQRASSSRLEAYGDWIFNLAVGAVMVGALFVGARFVATEVGLGEVTTAFGLGILTFLRVCALLVFATLIWTPVGVAIGFNPRLSRVLQPVVQIAASFPANFLFPAATIVFLQTGVSLNWGAILLMALGTQWYILFNTIAGAMAVPNDLREMAAVMNLRGWHLWKKLILPAIFPAWVTGAITAAGGAWNASIVAEVVSWGDRTLTAQGLGAYIASATEIGDWPRIVLGVFLMCLFVVVTNRLVWRRLYRLAETRFHLD